MAIPTTSATESAIHSVDESMMVSERTSADEHTEIDDNIGAPSISSKSPNISDEKVDPSSSSGVSSEITSEKLRNEKLRAFYGEEKHLLIVTWGGRPLFSRSRFGSVSDRFMTSLFGVVSLMPCNVERVNVMTGDEIRCFETLDGVKFIYLLCGPLYLFCITRSGESIQQIRNQLRFCHLLIVMTLTNVFEKTLAQSPQFDMRSIFGPTDYMMLHQLVLDEDRSPRFLFDSFNPLRITFSDRDAIGSTISRCKKEMTSSSGDFTFNEHRPSLN